MAIHRIQGPDGRIHRIEGPDNATPEQLFTVVQQQLDQEVLDQERRRQTGIFETFGKAAMRGAGQLGSTFTDIIPAAVGSALGFEDYARGQLKEAEQKKAEREAKYPTLFKSYKEIGGLGDFAQYATEAVGEQLANIATSLVPGIGAGKLAGSLAGAAAKRQIGEEVTKKGLIGEAATKFELQRLKELGKTQIEPRTAVGQAAGIYLGSYAQNAPEVFQNIFEETGQLAPGAAAIFGSVAAALDAVLPATLAKQLTAPAKASIVEKVLEKSGMDKGLVRSVTAGVLGGVGKEGVTEGAQEAISIAAERFVDDNPGVFGSKEWNRIVESAIKGAVAGGAFGGAGGGVEGLRARAEVKRKEAEEARKLGDEERANKLNAEVAEAEAQLAKLQQEAQMTLPGVEPVGPYSPTEPFGPPVPPKEPKQPKVKQAEMFTAEGALTPEMEKIAAKDQKSLEKQQKEQEEQFREAQQKLKTRLEEMTPPKNLVSLAQTPPALQQTVLQAQQDLDALAQKRAGKAPAPAAPQAAPTPAAPPVAPTKTEQAAPTPPAAPAPVTLETIQKIDDPVAFGKLLGIGRTARVLRADGPLAGADLSNPDDVKRVKAALDGYASGKPAPGAAEKIEKLFQRPEFQGVPTDATRPDQQSSGAGTEVLSGRDTGAAAGAAGEAKPSGMDTTGGDVSELAGRKGEKPGTLITPPEAPNYADMSLDELRQVRESADKINDALDLAAIRKHMGKEVAAAYEKMNRRQRMKWWEKNDLVAMEQDSSAFKGVDEELIDEYINAYNNFDTESPRDLGRSIALAAREADKPNFASSPEYVRLRNAFNYAKEQGWSSDEVLEGMRGKAKEWAGRDAQELFSRLFKETTTMAAPTQPAITEPTKAALPAPAPTAPKPPKKKKAAKPAEPAAPETRAEPEMTPEEAAYLADLYGKEQVPVEERGAMIRRKKATREEVRALEKEGDEATKSEAIFTKTGKKLSLPKYEGPAFDETQRRLAESGDVNGLLRNLLDSIKDPEIKQVLRRIRSLNLKTKIKIASIGQSGIYNNALTDTDPDTIFLDPEQGMNAHTFIHEAVHAAISNVLSNPNHPLTKQFQKFFISVQDRLGAAYGATDLQEFAAELMGNPSFQAILKTIKTPKSDSMFTRIIRSIAEFFGFADTRVGKALLETTAFNRGVQFLNDAIDITNDVPPTEAEQLFLSMGKNISKVISKVNNAMPAFAGRKVEETKNFLSNLSGSEVQQLAFNLLRLDSIYDMYKKELPSIKMLLDALEKRVGQEEKDVTRASENYKKFVKVQEQHAAAMRVLNDLAIDISDAQVDVLQSFQPRMIPTDRWNKMSQRQKDEFVAAENKRRQEHAKLKQRFDVLPEEVKDLYKTIRTEYDAAFKRYRSILEEAAKGSPALLAKLREEFTINQPLAGYIPYLRYGDYWLEFTDPKTNEPTSTAFESIRERDQFVASELKGVPHQKYEKLESIAFNEKNIPPTHFLNNVVNKLRSEGASDAQINGVYQAYLAAFPAESIAKQFMKRKGTRGMERDIVRGYSDLMVRWSRKLANSEYLPQIDRALAQIAQEGEAYQRNAPDGAPAIGAAVKNIESQKDFFHNPTYNNLVSGATQASFFMYMAGNISSAIINLTSLPLMVYPLLTGKFGWMDVPSVMLQAGRTAMNDWSKIDKYKKLYETLDSHGQLKHTMAREILEGRRQKTEDFTGIKARIMDGLAIPFSVTERYNRGATAIAAFDLAIKNGMNEQQAIDYALETVKTAHTSGMAATGPKWMQNSLGRIFFTFKSFIWNSAYVLARAFYQAFKGEKPEIREAARRQLIATYGMATVFVGVKGMPFYGAVSVLAEMLASMFGDDDEPFDFNAFLRELLPTFLYKGLFNYVINLEVANRAGIATDLVFRDDPRGVAENGYVLSAMQQAFGPVGSILVNSGRALELFKDGNYWRSIETLSPSFVRNGMKGVRYLNEGALTLKGDPVDEDIGVYNSMMQVVGFSPADLSNRYEMLQSGKGFEREVEKRRRDALRLYDMAARSGDAELMGEVRERIQSFNEKHPKYRITQDSLVRSRKAREAAEKDMIYGVRFNKNLRAEIKEKFFEDEE